VRPERIDILYTKTMDIAELLNITIEKKASDLHIIPGYHPSIRVNGQLFALKTYPVLTPESTKEMLLPILTDEKKNLTSDITMMNIDFV